MTEVYTTHKMPVETLWKAAGETCGGTMLKQLDPPDEDLSKVRFARSVFGVLKTKRKKGKQYARRSSGSSSRRRSSYMRSMLRFIVAPGER